MVVAVTGAGCQGPRSGGPCLWRELGCCGAGKLLPCRGSSDGTALGGDLAAVQRKLELHHLPCEEHGVARYCLSAGTSPKVHPNRSPGPDSGTVQPGRVVGPVMCRCRRLGAAAPSGVHLSSLSGTATGRIQQDAEQCKSLEIRLLPSRHLLRLSG